MFKISRYLLPIFFVGFSVNSFAEGVCAFCEESHRAMTFFRAGNVCASSGPTCRLAHMSPIHREAYSNGVGEGMNDEGLAIFSALERSSHPEVNMSRYLELEKDFASRGEPVDANNLIKFMGHLAMNPGSKCEFDEMSEKGSYGLTCGSGGSKKEFPGLSGKLLKEKFASFDKNPPPPPEPVKAPPPPETEVADESVEPEKKDVEVVENPQEDFLSIAEASEDEVKKAIIPNSLATDGVHFTEDEESVLPSAEKRDPASIGVR